MWKRDEPTRPGATAPDDGGTRAASVTTSSAQSGAGPGRPQEREVVNIGKSVIIKGELSGSEDLTIEGRVDGQIELRDHVLTIGPNGQISALVLAKSVIVMGSVTGNITATEKVTILENGSVEGDISAPTIAIVEGAQFRGRVDMQPPSALRSPSTKTVAASSTAAKAVLSSEAPHLKSRPTVPAPAPTPAAGAAH